MKKKLTLVIAAMLSGVLSLQAQDIDLGGGWGNFSESQQDESGLDGDLTSEEAAMLDALYNEEADEDLQRMLQSEEFIFPTSLTDNWHMTFQVGDLINWGSYGSKTSFGSLNNIALAVGIGKYLSPVNDVRIRLFYGRNTGVHGPDMAYAVDAANPGVDYPEKYQKNPNYVNEIADYHTYSFNTLALGLTWLPNITNLIMGYDPDRKWTFSLMAGIDLEHTFGYSDKELSLVSVWAESAKQSVHRDLVGLNFGAQIDYAMNKRWHFTFEVEDNFLDDIYDGIISDQSWDGHVNCMLGATMFFKTKNRDGRIQNRLNNQDKFLNYQENIYKTRQALDSTLANRQEEVNVVKVTKDVTYTLIAFSEDDNEVARLQQNNVFTAAEVYKQIPNSQIFITNASKLDDKLFHQRAWNISSLLHLRWQIPYDKIWVDSDESHIQKMQLPDCKHYIIMIIND